MQPLLFSFVLLFPYETSLSKEKLSALVIGFVYTGIYILTSWASRRSGYIADRFGNLTGVLNGTLLIGLLFGSMSGALYSDEYSMITILSILFFLGIFIIENIRKPIGVSYIANLTKENILATSLSAESQVKGIFAAVLAPVIGVIADTFGVNWGVIIVSVGLALTWPLLRLKQNFDI